jgi:hypothetical protein
MQRGWILLQGTVCKNINRMLFIDYSSAFNTIVPAKLIIKVEALGLNPALCNWVLDVLTGRPQVAKVGNITLTPLILNTGAPQGCVLSPRSWSWTSADSRGSTPPLSKSKGQQWTKWKVLSSWAYTSPTNWNGPPTQTVWWIRCNSVSSASGG